MYHYNFVYLNDKTCFKNISMAHLFDQVYVDEIDFEEPLTLDQLINLIFMEFVHRQILQLVGSC